MCPRDQVSRGATAPHSTREFIGRRPSALHLKQAHLLGIPHVTLPPREVSRPAQRPVRIFGLHVGRIAIAGFADHDKTALRQHGQRKPQIAATASQPSRPGNRMSPAWATGCFSVCVPRKVRVDSKTFASNWQCDICRARIGAKDTVGQPTLSRTEPRTRTYGPTLDDGTARNRTARNA